MAEDEKREVEDLTRVKLRGIDEVRAFLEDLGDGIKFVESIVTDVSGGVRLILRANQALIGAIAKNDVDAEIDFHKRRIEELEASRKVRKL